MEELNKNVPETEESEVRASNFIHDFIDEDLKEGVYDKPVFRPSLTVICI